jgi:putative NADH-flavin reductase
MKIAVLGATGKLGRVLTARAVEKGHEVKAFVRTPKKLGALEDRVEVVQGDLADPDAVDRAIEGVEAVVSCLGPTKLNASMPPLFEAGTKAIVEAMERHGVRRIVAVSGGAAPQPGDVRPLGNRMMTGLMGVLGRNIVESNRRVLEVLRASDLEWIGARAGNMTDGAGGTAVRPHGTTPQGWSISRVDLADFMLAQLMSDNWVRQAPFVTS